MTECITIDKWRGERLSAVMTRIYVLDKSDPRQLDMLGPGLQKEATP